MFKRYTTYTTYTTLVVVDVMFAQGLILPVYYHWRKGR
jgi:hypothetical protein